MVVAINDYVTTAQLCQGQNANGSGISQDNRTVYALVYVPITMTFDLITTNVATAAASSVLRMGIWTPHATTFRPATLVLDCGTVSSATTGEKTISISQQLTPGFYWLGVNVQTAVNARTRMLFHPGFLGMPYPTATSPGAQTVSNVLMYTDSVSGVFASNPTMTLSHAAGNAFWPLMGLRRSA